MKVRDYDRYLYHGPQLQPQRQGHQLPQPTEASFIFYNVMFVLYHVSISRLKIFIAVEQNVILFKRDYFIFCSAGRTRLYNDFPWNWYVHVY